MNWNWINKLKGSKKSKELKEYEVPEIVLDEYKDTFENTFENTFKSIKCQNQVPCQKCNGCGFMSLSGYFDQGAICFTICPICGGCGSVNDTKELNYTKIKKEIENYNLSLYFDESKNLFS